MKAFTFFSLVALFAFFSFEEPEPVTQAANPKVAVSSKMVIVETPPVEARAALDLDIMEPEEMEKSGDVVESKKTEAPAVAEEPEARAATEDIEDIGKNEEIEDVGKVEEIEEIEEVGEVEDAEEIEDIGENEEIEDVDGIEEAGEAGDAEKSEESGNAEDQGEPYIPEAAVEDPVLIISGEGGEGRAETAPEEEQRSIIERLIDQ